MGRWLVVEFICWIKGLGYKYGGGRKILELWLEIWCGFLGGVNSG